MKYDISNDMHVHRARNRWTQQDLADHSGLSKNHVHMIEVGKVTPNLDSCFAIARAFGVGIEEIWTADEYEEEEC